MLIIIVSEGLNNVKNTRSTLSIPKACCFREKKRLEKSTHYANILSIYSYDQKLYYVSSVIPPDTNSICSFPIVRTEGRCIKMPLCSLVSKFLRQGIQIVFYM